MDGGHTQLTQEGPIGGSVRKRDREELGYGHSVMVGWGSPEKDLLSRTNCNEAIEKKEKIKTSGESPWKVLSLKDTEDWETGKLRGVKNFTIGEKARYSLGNAKGSSK